MAMKWEDETAKEIQKIKKILVFGFVFILGIIIFTCLLGCFYTIDSGESGALLTLGKVNPIAKSPGLHFKVPIAQKIIKFDITTQKYEAEAGAASKDLQVVSTKIVTNYKLIGSEVSKIYSEIGRNYAEKIIHPMVQEVTKSATAKFTAEELITQRETVRLEIKNALIDRLKLRNIIVEEVSITNFDFSQSFNEAIENKVTAEQLKLKAEMDLERIQVEAAQIEATAIGNKNAQIAQAQGEAERIKLIDEQLKRSPAYIEWLKINKWDGSLPKVTGGVIPLINVE